MMYSEFIERTKFGENYITESMYHDFIEPAYMNAPETITKDIFCKDFYKLHNKVVNTVVTGLICKKSIDEKVNYINNHTGFDDVSQKQTVLLNLFLESFTGIAKDYYRK